MILLEIRGFLKPLEIFIVNLLMQMNFVNYVNTKRKGIYVICQNPWETFVDMYMYYINYNSGYRTCAKRPRIAHK